MTTSKTHAERIKVGIVANEFFQRELGGIGGFGWAARQVALLFKERPERGFEAVFLNRTLPPAGKGVRALAHDTPLIMRSGGRRACAASRRSVSTCC